MKTLIAKGAIALFDARVFDTVEISVLLGQTEAEIYQLLSAVREMRLELGDPRFMAAQLDTSRTIEVTL